MNTETQRPAELAAAHGSADFELMKSRNIADRTANNRPNEPKQKGLGVAGAQSSRRPRRRHPANFMMTTKELSDAGIVRIVMPPNDQAEARGTAT